MNLAFRRSETESHSGPHQNGDEVTTSQRNEEMLVRELMHSSDVNEVAGEMIYVSHYKFSEGVCRNELNARFIGIDSSIKQTTSGRILPNHFDYPADHNPPSIEF